MSAPVRRHRDSLGRGAASAAALGCLPSAGPVGARCDTDWTRGAHAASTPVAPRSRADGCGAVSGSRRGRPHCGASRRGKGRGGVPRFAGQSRGLESCGDAIHQRGRQTLAKQDTQQFLQEKEKPGDAGEGQVCGGRTFSGDPRWSGGGGSGGRGLCVSRCHCLSFMLTRRVWATRFSADPAC